MRYFPIFVDAENKPCAVYGGGEEATQKVHGLLQAGAQVTVNAPTLITEELKRQVADGSISHLAEEYDPQKLDCFALVMVAGDVRTLARESNRMPEIRTPGRPPSHRSSVRSA
jgi:siroheme synthase-like protein